MADEPTGQGQAGTYSTIYDIVVKATGTTELDTLYKKVEALKTLLDTVNTKVKEAEAKAKTKPSKAADDDLAKKTQEQTKATEQLAQAETKVAAVEDARLKSQVTINAETKRQIEMLNQIAKIVPQTTTAGGGEAKKVTAPVASAVKAADMQTEAAERRRKEIERATTQEAEGVKENYRTTIENIAKEAQARQNATAADMAQDKAKADNELKLLNDNLDKRKNKTKTALDGMAQDELKAIDRSQQAAVEAARKQRDARITDARSIYSSEASVAKQAYDEAMKNRKSMTDEDKKAVKDAYDNAMTRLRTQKQTQIDAAKKAYEYEKKLIDSTATVEKGKVNTWLNDRITATKNYFNSFKAGLAGVAQTERDYINAAARGRKDSTANLERDKKKYSQFEQQLDSIAAAAKFKSGKATLEKLAVLQTKLDKAEFADKEKLVKRLATMQEESAKQAATETKSPLEQQFGSLTGIVKGAVFGRVVREMFDMFNSLKNVYMDILRMGFDFFLMLEKQRTGLAAVISQTHDMSVDGVAITDNAERYNAALNIAKELQGQILNIANASMLTLEEINEVSMQGIALLSARKISLNQQVPLLAKILSAEKAIGVQQQQLFIEMRQLLQGDLYRGMLARQLVQAGKISVKELRELQGEKLVEVLTKALYEFEYAGLRHMKTIQGRWEVFTDTMKFQFAGIFDNTAIKEGINSLLDMLQNKFFTTLTVKGKQMTILSVEGQHIVDVLKLLTSALTEVTSIILKIPVSWITRIVASLMSFGAVAAAVLAVTASIAVLNAAIQALGWTVQLTAIKLGGIGTAIIASSMLLSEFIKHAVESRYELHKTMVELNGVSVEVNTATVALAKQQVENGKRLGDLLEVWDDVTKTMKEGKLSTDELAAAEQIRADMIPELIELTDGSSISLDKNTTSVEKNRDAIEMKRRADQDSINTIVSALDARKAEIELQLKLNSLKDQSVLKAQQSLSSEKKVYEKSVRDRREYFKKHLYNMDENLTETGQRLNTLLMLFSDYATKMEESTGKSLDISSSQLFSAMEVPEAGGVKERIKDLTDGLQKGNTDVTHMAEGMVAMVESIKEAKLKTGEYIPELEQVYEFSKKNPEAWKEFVTVIKDASLSAQKFYITQRLANKGSFSDPGTAAELKTELAAINGTLEQIGEKKKEIEASTKIDAVIDKHEQLVLSYDRGVSKLNHQKEIWEDILGIVKDMTGYTAQDERVTSDLTNKLEIIKSKIAALQNMRQFMPETGQAELQIEINKLIQQRSNLEKELSELNVRRTDYYAKYLSDSLLGYIDKFGNEMGGQFLKAFDFVGVDTVDKFKGFLSELPGMGGEAGQKTKEMFISVFTDLDDEMMRIISDLSQRQAEFEIGKIRAKIAQVNEELQIVSTVPTGAAAESQDGLKKISDLKVRIQTMSQEILDIRAKSERDQEKLEQLFLKIRLENERKGTEKILEQRRKLSDSEVDSHKDTNSKIEGAWNEHLKNVLERNQVAFDVIEQYTAHSKNVIDGANKELEQTDALYKKGLKTWDELTTVRNKTIATITGQISKLGELNAAQRDSLTDLGNRLATYKQAVENFNLENNKKISLIGADGFSKEDYEKWLADQKSVLDKLEENLNAAYQRVKPFIDNLKGELKSVGDVKISGDVLKVFDEMTDVSEKGIKLLTDYQVSVLGFGSQVLETFTVLSNALSKFNASLPKTVGQVFGLFEAFTALQKKVKGGIVITVKTDDAGNVFSDVTANNMADVFKEGFTNGFGGFMNALPTMMGFVGVFSGIATTTFSAIKGMFTKAAERIAEEIHNDMTAIMTRYQNEDANLITTLNDLTRKRQEAIDRLSHQKGGQDELNQLLPELDAAINQLKEEQRAIFKDFDQQLKLLLIDESLRDIQSSFDQIVETYKRYIDAGGDIAKANLFLAESFTQLRERLDKELLDEQKALNDALSDENKAWLQGAEDDLGNLISMERRAMLDIDELRKELFERQQDRAEQVKEAEDSLAKFVEDKEKEINDIKNEGLAQRRKSTTQDKLDRIAAIQDEITQERLKTRERLEQIAEEDAADAVRTENEITRINNRLQRDREAHDERLEQIITEGNETINQLQRELDFLDELTAAYNTLGTAIANARNGVHSHVGGGSPNRNELDLTTPGSGQSGEDQRIYDMLLELVNNATSATAGVKSASAGTTNNIDVTVTISKTNATDKDIETAVYSAITKAVRKV